MEAVEALQNRFGIGLRKRAESLGSNFLGFDPQNHLIVGGVDPPVSRVPALAAHIRTRSGGEAS